MNNIGSEIGFPFQGAVYYTEEATYNGGHDGTVFRFSDAVNVCRLESGDVNKTLRHVGSAEVADFSTTLIDPRLHLEFVWQPTTLNKLNDWIARTSGDISSFCVEFNGSKDRSSASSTFVCNGCKCDTMNIKASTGDNYIVTMDCSVSSVVTSPTATETDPGAVGTTFAAFNRAGGITWGTGSYYVTKSIDVTINNNLNDYWDVGSTSKKASIPGALDVSGSVDISLDEGGAVHWNTITAGTDIPSIKCDAGCDASTYDVFTISNGRWTSGAVENNVSGEGLFDSTPFVFKTIAFSTS